MNHATTASATTNDVIKPIPIRPRISWVSRLRYLVISYTLAAIIVGNASRKENSVAAGRLTPRSNPPMIVAAERDVPGISESTWANPITSASFHVIESTVIVRFSSLVLRSMRMIAMPPITSEMPIESGPNKYVLIKWCVKTDNTGGYKCYDQISAQTPGFGLCGPRKQACDQLLSVECANSEYGPQLNDHLKQLGLIRALQ